MAPRRNTSSSASKKGSLNSGSMTQLRMTRPYPYTQTPPADPPTIRLNRPVTLTTTPKIANTEEPGQLRYSDVVDSLNDLGYTDFFFTMNYVQVWADSSLDAINLVMSDFNSGVTASDNGTLDSRARVGLNYPPVMQIPRTSGASDPIVNLSVSSGTVSQCDIRVGVNVWNKTTVL